MWFWWALASAFVSGISVTFNKRVLNRGVHSSVVAFAIFAIVTILSFPMFITSGNPEVDTTFFFAATISAIVFSISKTIGLNIFKNNNLSDVYPLASIAPVTLYALSVLFLEENVRPMSLLGIVLMAIGVYLLNFKRENKNIFHPFFHFFQNKYSIMFLGAILLSNISAIAEKIALNHTAGQSVAPLAFWENLFLTVITGVYVIKSNKNWLKEIKDHFGNLLIAGVLFSLVYFLFMFGFKEGPISLVSAIKKVEVLVVLGISYVLFGERPTKKIYIASIIMLISVLLIKL